MTVQYHSFKSAKGGKLKAWEWKSYIQGQIFPLLDKKP